MTPTNPKIYHILHVDKLLSIIASNGLLSDAEVICQGLNGTVIGMNSIKKRRLHELTLETYPNLYVGECVPFYFCPRSVMLYMMYKGNSPEYFDDTNDIANINKLNWEAINARNWMNCRSEKQAEFLCESFVEWDLVQRIGVNTLQTYRKVQSILSSCNYKPLLEIKHDWYY